MSTEQDINGGTQIRAIPISAESSYQSAIEADVATLVLAVKMIHVDTFAYIRLHDVEIMDDSCLEDGRLIYDEKR